MWVGTFAVIMMIYLFLAPKLVKKPSGTPPRSGSNAEKQAIAETMAGAPPMGGGAPMVEEVYPPRRGFNVQPTAEAAGDTGAFKLGQAYRARRRARRARRAFRGIRSRAKGLNLFPFANVGIA
jgi:hypothetical protein